MSRRKTQDQLDQEAEQADRDMADRYRLQRECSHWHARPTEWYWSGRVREMTCQECGATRFLEDEDL